MNAAVGEMVARLECGEEESLLRRGNGKKRLCERESVRSKSPNTQTTHKNDDIGKEKEEVRIQFTLR